MATKLSLYRMWRTKDIAIHTKKTISIDSIRVSEKDSHNERHTQIKEKHDRYINFKDISTFII